MDYHGSTHKRRSNFLLENCIDEGRFALEFPTIRDKVRELGLGYIFAEPKESNLTLVRKVYENWDTSFGKSNEVKIWGQIVLMVTDNLDDAL
ncbi:hypothetical protein HAX54_031023 [Datura stramonium]|uniref:Uncharacterized protein n=1 Tax=Datura stramonium TaxID=4076 RepID=A0ABS8RL34_DATST|nr:hypothetical protein [Datura stramonium]